MQKAVKSFIWRRELAEKERQYVEGYRKHPETAEEIGWADRLGCESLAREPWD